MRVLHINTKYSIGGAARIANILHRKLLEMGYESRFCYGRGHGYDDDPKAFDDPYAYRASSKRVILMNYAYSRFTGHDIFMPKKYVKLCERLIEWADIVHVHNLHGFVWNPLKIIELLKKAKVIVWTIHDLWLITGRCAFPFMCEGFKDGCRKCMIKSNYPKALIDNARNYWQAKLNVIKSLVSKTVFVTPSIWAKETLESSLMLKALGRMNIVVINNGIDKQIFSKRSRAEVTHLKRKLGIEEGKKIVLFISERLDDPRKGMEFILEILKYFKNSEELLFIGVGKKIEDLKSYRNFIQVGYIHNPNELALFYNMADVYVLPSLDDNYPTTVLEAISCGTPVVAFNVGGIPEIIENGKNGYILKVRDVNALSEAIIKAMELKDKFNNSIVKSLEDFVEEYIELYNNIHSLIRM